MQRDVRNYWIRNKFGAGAVEAVGQEVDRLGGTHVMISTDEGVIKAGLLDRVIPWLENAGKKYSIWDGVEANPSDKNLLQGKAFYLDNNCDIVVSVGGGSPMDCSKGVALLASHPGVFQDYRGPSVNIYDKVDPTKLPPHIAIATTAGTGSEVSTSMVITDTVAGHKISVDHVHLLPSVAITDPEIMATMPPAITAATGMDALSHNVEAFFSPKGDRLSTPLSRTGIELIGSSLLRAFRDGDDMEARTDMAFASCCGAWGFNQNSVGAPHPLGHQITTRYGLPHGTACAIMYPAWLRLIKPYAAEKLGEVAKALGVDISNMPADEAADAAIGAFIQLYEALDLPKTLREVGVEEFALADMSSHAMADFVTGKLDPYPDYNEDVMLRLYRETW